MHNSQRSRSSSTSSTQRRPRVPSSPGVSFYEPYDIYPRISSPDIWEMWQEVLFSRPSSWRTSAEDETCSTAKKQEKKTNAVTLMQWPRGCDCTLYKIEDLADDDDKFLNYVIKMADEYCQSSKSPSCIRRDLSKLVTVANDMISSHWERRNQAGSLKTDEKKLVFTVLPLDNKHATLEYFQKAPGHTRVNRYCPFATRRRAVADHLRKELEETISKDQCFEGSAPASDDEEKRLRIVRQEMVDVMNPDLIPCSLDPESSSLYI